MRNYDSVDSTPLFLIAIHRFIEVGGDRKFRSHIEPFVAQALEWLDNYGDSNQDRFIDYQFRPERKYGGLVTQNWMDSSEAVFHETGDEVVYPVAPVEVQAYAYLALHLWGKNEDAERLKELFNQKFIHDGKLASAIDGRGRAITSARSSVGHCLWAARVIGGGKVDSIVADQYIPAVVGSLLSRELFEPAAGIRTLSTASRGFNPQSYHNGSIWPHDNSLIAEGLENFGFYREARAVREAMLSAISHFQTPIEMFAYQDGLREYCSSSGQTACRKQAWSAASLLCDIAWL